MTAKPAPPGDTDVARTFRSRRKHETKRRKLMQVPEIIGKRRYGEARLGNLRSGVERDEFGCPTLQLNWVDLLSNSGFETRHFAVVGQVSLPVPNKPNKQTANCYRAGKQNEAQFGVFPFGARCCLWSDSRLKWLPVHDANRCLIRVGLTTVGA